MHIVICNSCDYEVQMEDNENSCACGRCGMVVYNER
jgi:ribosomal protein S27AE